MRDHAAAHSADEEGDDVGVGHKPVRRKNRIRAPKLARSVRWTRSIIGESCKKPDSGSRGIAPEYEIAAPQYPITPFGPRRYPCPDPKPAALPPGSDMGQDLSSRLCPGSVMTGPTLPRLSSILATLLLCGSGIGSAARGIAGSEKCVRTVLRDIPCPKSARSIF
jgi:hypothetical protein